MTSPTDISELGRMRRPVVENVKDRRKIKPARWSHQNELTSLVGKKIRVLALDGTVDLFTLLAADQFTLHVLNENGCEMTIFKHASAGYTVEIDPSAV